MRTSLFATALLGLTFLCCGCAKKPPTPAETAQFIDACDKGDLRQVRWFLNRRTNPELLKAQADDLYRSTAVHAAAANGRREVLELLLKNGADVNAKDGEGATALHRAAYAGDLDMIGFLLDHGAGLEVKGGVSGDTPLLLAVRGGIPERFGGEAAAVKVIALLISRGANVNAKDNLLETPLHVAAFIGSAPMAEALISGGADVNALGMLGGTPLAVATTGGHKEVADLLRAHGGRAQSLDDLLR